MCARRRSGFLLLRQKKVTKERATLLSATPSLRYGATWGARSRGAPQNSLRADALRSNNCGESVHEAWALRRPCPPRALRAPGAYRREPANRTSIRAIAALGPACAARGACAHEMGPSAAKARAAAWLFGCWMFDCPTPCWLRLRRGGCGVSMGVEAPMPCELTRRGCPSGAPQAQSEFHGAPRNRPAAGSPLRNAKGSQTGGRLSFGYFSLAKQRTSTSPAGASPGSRPEHWHAVATESPGFSKRRPNAPGKTQ